MPDKKENQKLLRNHGLKPTEQRILLSEIIFNGKDGHFCADDLKKIISKKKCRMSLATIYNNLQNFADVGLLKKRKVSSSKTYFDNNISNHYHFYDEEKDELIDISTPSIEFLKFPKLPNNKKISSVDLVINIKKK